MLTNLTRARYDEFARVVRSRGGRWLILTHDNPDPDSLASAAGLAKILRRAFRHQVTIAYGGIIGRAENQEMVKTLGLRLSHVRHLKWKNYRNIALVDAQPGTGNNQLDDILPHLVFDHHPMRRATQKVRFADVRTEYGATATMIAEYVSACGHELNKREATAFVYAIRSETQDFGREYSPHDKQLFEELLPRADNRALARIQTPRLPLSYFRNLHEALGSLQAVGSLVVAHLRHVDQPDIVPEIADLLLRLEGKTWSFCTGIFEGRVYTSLRTTNPRADAGRLMRRILGRRGKGGGHGMMAGGWIDGNGPGSLEELQTALARRLAKTLGKNPDRLVPIPLSLAAADDAPAAAGRPNRRAR